MAGSSKYDFDSLTGIGDGNPWEEIEDTRISLVGRFSFGEKGMAIIIPSARYNGEKRLQHERRPHLWPVCRSCLAD